MTAEEYVELREGRGSPVKRDRDGSWYVECPAHDSTSRSSLHVSEGQDRVLLHCFAGCSFEDILGADGLTSADLRQERRNGRAEAAVYIYADELGVPLFEVVRTEAKDFWQRLPGAKSGGIKGARRVLYRLARIVAAVQAGETVWIAEGEKDVHALEIAGVVATCNPGGAGKWRDEYAETLRGAEVVVVADRDQPGRAHAAEVGRALEGVAASVRVVEPAAGKDAADHLAAGKTTTEFVAVALEPMGSSDQGRYDGRVLDLKAALAEPDTPIPWRCENLVADGFLTVLAGRGGEGKSWLALSLAAGVARGETAAGIPCTKGRALLFDAENGPRLMVRRFRAAGVGADTGVQPVNAGGLRVTTDLDWFRRVIKEERADFVVFDSLRVLSSGSKESDGDEMEPIVTALKELARTTGAAVLLVHHRGKAESSEYRGSSVILDQTDLLFTLGRVAGDPDGRHRRKITTIKCRIEEEPSPRWVRIESPVFGRVQILEAEPFEGEDAPRPRDEHRDKVLEVLGGIARSGRSIARKLDLSEPTVRRVLHDLEADERAERRPDGWVRHCADPLGGDAPDAPPENGSTKPSQGASPPLTHPDAPNGNGWKPHLPEEGAPGWWPS